MIPYSLWEEEVFLSPVDVTIAGAGFAGLWTAWHLKKAKPGMRVRILDKQLVPSGASTRNAGFACFGSLTELIADAGFVGESAMKELVAMRFEGLQILTTSFSHEAINYTQGGGYELIPPGQFSTPADLRDKTAWMNDLLSEITGTPATFQQAPALLQQFRFTDTQYLVENRLEGQLHPGKVIAILISRLQHLGVDIRFGIEVQGYTRTGGQVMLATNIGRIFSNQLLIATNAFAPALSPAISVIPARGQLLLTHPIPGLRFKGCFHADEGYIYFRDIGHRVLLGGARNKAFEAEETLEHTVTETIQQELENYLGRVILPDTKVGIERRWSGIMGMSTSRMPIVKQLETGVFTAGAMGGIGVAVGPVIGRKAAELLINA